MLVVELLEHLRLEVPLPLDRVQDLLALVMRRRLHQVRQLRRMKPGQAPRAEAQARPRDVAHERLEPRPWHEPPGPAGSGAPAAGHDASQAGAEARVDPGHPPRALFEGELDLPGADQSRGVDVDEAAAKDIGP